MPNFGNQGGRKSNVPAVPGSGSGNPVGQLEIVAPNCKVCQSPHRREIDMMLATGWSQVGVMNHWNQILGDDFFSKHNISRHKNRHLTTRDAAVRRIYEERARQIGMDVDNVEGFIVTKASVLDTIIQHGVENLHRGATVAEPREVLQAIQLLDKMEAEWKETAIDELMVEFKAFAEAVKEVVGEESYDEIFAAFERRLDSKNPKALNPVPPPATDEIDLSEEDYREDD